MILGYFCECQRTTWHLKQQRDSKIFNFLKLLNWAPLEVFVVPKPEADLFSQSE